MNAVYASLLTANAGTFVGAAKPLQNIVVLQESSKPRSTIWSLIKERLTALREDTYESYVASNAMQYTVAMSAAGPYAVRVVTDAELPEGEHVEDSMREFHVTYPDAVLITLSAVGFSRDRRQALVYMTEPAYYGAFYLLERSGDEWVVAGEYVAWVT